MGLPGAPDATEVSHLFLAAAYVASGPAANAPGEVTIYNGVIWGWANIVFSVNSLFGLAQAFDRDMTSVAFLNSTFDTDLTELFTPTSFEMIDEAFDAELAELAVPEPSAFALSSILFTLLGMFQASLRLKTIPQAAA